MDLEFELASEQDAPSRAREAVDRIDGELAPEVGDNLRLVLSELVTNSVQFAPGNPIRVKLSSEAPDHLIGKVEDRGSGTVAIRPGGADGGGLGLMIVDSLCERWGVDEGTTHVWFELRAGAV
jgi:signal transduction histidine kinase